MSDVIGSLVLELRAEMGQFITNLGNASSAARRAGREISDSFSAVGSIASVALRPFGELGSTIAIALGQAGSLASSATAQFAKLGGGLSGFAVAGGAAAGIMAAIDLGAVGLATHTAENATQMGRLAQATGINVSTLSGLAPVAQLSGLSMDELARGLGRFEKSAYAAANAPAGAINAFNTLSVSLREVNGNYRPTIEILGDFAAKIRALPDGIEKTALVMQTMGRDSARLVPFLNQGKDALLDFYNYAQKVNALTTPDIVANADKFEAQLIKLKLAGQGLANTLTAELLPMLTALSEHLGEALADHDSDLNNLISGIVDVTKVTFVLGEAFAYIFGEFGSLVRHAAAEVVLLYDALSNLPSAAKTLPALLAAPATGGASLLSLKGTDLAAATKANVQAIADEEKKRAEDLAKLQAEAFGPGVKAVPGATGGGNLRGQPGGAFGSGGRPDEVTKLIADLNAQSAAELSVATAVDKSAGAMVMAKAIAEADAKIRETRNSLLEKERALTEQLASEQASQGPTAVDRAGNALEVPAAARTAARLAEVKRELQELSGLAPDIRTAFEAIGSSKFVSETSKQLEEFGVKTRNEAEEARKMSAAFEAGGDAIPKALDAAKLEPFRQKLQEIQKLIDWISTAKPQDFTVRVTQVLQQIGFKPPEIKEILGEVGDPVQLLKGLQTAYQQINQQITSTTAAEAKTREDVLSAEIGKETNVLRGEVDAYRILGEAALKSSAEQREAAAHAVLARFDVANPDATPKQRADVYANALEQQRLQYGQTVLQKAAELDLVKTYEDEIDTLQRARAILEERAKAAAAYAEQRPGDTAAADQAIAAANAVAAANTAIHSRDISEIANEQKAAFDAANAELEGNARLYESQRQLIEGYIRMADAAGTFADRTRAAFASIILDGQDAAGKMFEAFSHAVGGIADQLAEISVTGKGNLRGVFEGLEKSVVSAGLKGVFSNVAGGIENIFPGLKIPGLGGPKETLGTAGNPMHVIIAGGLTLPGPGAGGAGGAGGAASISNLLGLGLGLPGSIATAPTFAGPAAFSSTGTSVPSLPAAFATAAPNAISTAPSLLTGQPLVPWSATGPAVIGAGPGAPFPLTPPELESLPFQAVPQLATSPFEALTRSASAPVLAGASPAITTTAPAAALTPAVGVPSYTFNAPPYVPPPLAAQAGPPYGFPPPVYAGAPAAPSYTFPAAPRAAAPPTSSLLAPQNEVQALTTTLPAFATLGLEASNASRGVKIAAPIAAAGIGLLGRLLSPGGPRGAEGGTSAGEGASPFAAAGPSGFGAAPALFPSKVTPAFASEPSWSAAANGGYFPALRNEFSSLGRGFEGLFGIHPPVPAATPSFAAASPAFTAPMLPPEMESLPFTEQGMAESTATSNLGGAGEMSYTVPGATALPAAASLIPSIMSLFAPKPKGPPSQFAAPLVGAPGSQFLGGGGMSFSSPYAGEGTAPMFGPASPAGPGAAGTFSSLFAMIPGIGGAGGAGGANATGLAGGRGSAADPMYVIEAGGGAGGQGGAAGIGGAVGGISKLLGIGGGGGAGATGGLGSSKENPMYVIDVGSGVGGGTGGLASMFGGGGGGGDTGGGGGGGGLMAIAMAFAGMQAGGDVEHGKAYIVGEKRPEVFVPGMHGKIIPSIREAMDAGMFGGGKQAGGDVAPGQAYLVGEKRPELFYPGMHGKIVPSVRDAMGSGGEHQTNTVTMHIHGVSDFDSFRKSSGQIMTEMHRQLETRRSRSR